MTNINVLQVLAYNYEILHTQLKAYSLLYCIIFITDFYLTTITLCHYWHYPVHSTWNQRLQKFMLKNKLQKWALDTRESWCQQTTSLVIILFQNCS